MKLLALLLVGLLAACGTSRQPAAGQGSTDQAERIEAATTQCKEYYDSAHVWRLVRKRFPESLAEMEQPLSPDDDRLFLRIEADPWGNAYRFERGAKTIRIRCVGPDGKPETGDDIAYPVD